MYSEYSVTHINPLYHRVPIHGPFDHHRRCASYSWDAHLDHLRVVPGALQTAEVLVAFAPRGLPEDSAIVEVPRF